MKFLTLIITLIILNFIVPCQAGELTIGVGKTDGHSAASDRCINPGYGMDLSYTDSIGQVAIGLFRANLNIGAMAEVATFETAYRPYAGGPESKQREEQSVALSVITKPTITFWRFSYYWMWGYGPALSGPDGTSMAWHYGTGWSVRLTDRLSFGMSTRRSDRHDTGNMRYNTVGNFSFTF